MRQALALTKHVRELIENAERNGRYAFVRDPATTGGIRIIRAKTEKDKTFVQSLSGRWLEVTLADEVYEG